LEERADHQVRRQLVLAPDVAAPATAQGLRKASAVEPPVAAESTQPRQEGFVFGGARRSAAQETTAANKSTSLGGAPPARPLAAGERANAEIAVVGQATEERVLVDGATDRDAASRDKAEAAANAPQPEQKAQAYLRISAANEQRGASSLFQNAGGAAPATKTRFAILSSTPGAQTEMGVAADGAISFRSVDAASGTITITHVYQP
jgi:hypothetical protein